MPTTKIIRYQTHPQDAAENARLIREVFAELTADPPSGLHYTSYQLDDGVSFVHVAVLDDETRNPLLDSAAFAKFQAGIKDRCAEGPVAADATVIGSFPGV